MNDRNSDLIELFPDTGMDTVTRCTVSRPIHSVICKQNVTPIQPGNDCSYYEKRSADFLERHREHINIEACCKEPTYYINYGYKYCSRFRKTTYYKLSSEGRIWMLITLNKLQEYMEDGVSKKTYISELNKGFNYRVEEKGGLYEFYTGIECRNNDFSDFAFATHPDAYRPKEMANLSFSDWFEISRTPDWKEWLNGGTWEQAWIVGKEVGVEITPEIVKDAYKTSREAVSQAYRYIMDLF